MVREIPLTQGQVAVVDDEDYEDISQFRWHARRVKTGFYAKRSIGFNDASGRRTCRAEFIHQRIAARMGIASPDHKDRNGLNNTRGNLRQATRSQNDCNRGRSSRGTCPYKGVSPVSKRRSLWIAEIQFERVKYVVGHFKTPEDAARAYDAKAKELHGEFAFLNFPENVA